MSFKSGLLKEIASGNFLNMVRELESGNVQIDTAIAAKIVVACYMGLDNCIKKDTWSGRIREDFLNILNTTLHYIRCPADKVIISFLQSAYHMVKLLLQAADVLYILKLKVFFLPKFMPPVLNVEQKSIYVSMGTAIFKFVARKSQTVMSPEAGLYDLCLMSTEIWNKYADNVTYLNNCYHCLYSLNALKFEDKKQNEYYVHVLTNCKIHSEECQDDLFLSLANFLQLYFTNNLKNNNFTYCISAYRDWLPVAQKLLTVKHQQSLCEVFEFNCLLLELENTTKLVKVLKNCHAILKMYFKLSNADNCLKSVCQMIVNTFFRMACYYKNESKSTWLDIPLDTQLKIFNFCSDVAHILTKTPFNCSCEKCGADFLYYDNIKLLTSVSGLARKCLSENKIVSRKYKLDILQCLEKALASIVTLKDKGCDRWRSCWCEVGVNLYNMSIQMYKLDDPDALLYIKLFIKNMVRIEGSHISVVIGDTIAYSAFALLTEIYFKANDLKRCLIMTALLLFLFPQHRDSEFNRWIKVKIAAKESSLLEAEDNLQTITLCSALEDYKEQVSEFIPDLKLTSSEKSELLVFELDLYKQRWKSKISMMSAYMDLTRVASLSMLVDVSVQIWYEFSSTFHDDVPRLIHSVVVKGEERFSKVDSLQSQDIRLAFLYFTYYAFKFKLTVVKQHTDVEETVNYVKNIDGHKHGIPSDPNDACDIVSSYQRLTIEKHLLLIKYLNKSLSLIASFCKSEKCSDHFKVWNTADVYDLLMKISYEYRMHYNHLPYLHASELALKLATFMEDNLRVLKAITNLVDVANVDKSYMKELIIKADQIVSDINSNTEESDRSIITYHICKANAYLYEDVEKASESFKKADTLLSSWKWKEDQILSAQLHLVHAKLIMLPCEYNIEGHEEFSLVKIHMAHACVVTVLSKHFSLNPDRHIDACQMYLEKIQKVIKVDSPFIRQRKTIESIITKNQLQTFENSKSVHSKYILIAVDTSYKMSVVLDVKETMIKMYHLQKMPREVRCYARDIVILTQEFLLPLRTSVLLTYLAYADLLSCRLDDCNTKISGICDILCLGKYKVNASPQKIEASPCKLDAEIANDFASLNLQEVTLDLPQSKPKQTSPGSPNLMSEPFKPPHFVNHNPVCDCFYCNCMEYQTLVFYKIHLEALSNLHQNNMALAQDFFYGSSQMRTHLFKKEKYYVYRACEMIHKDLIIYPREFYLEPYCYIILDYCNSLLKLNNKKSPKKVNQEMIEYLKPKKLKYNILYMNFIMQKVIIEFRTPKIDAYGAVSVLEAPTVVNELLLTPESKHTTVTFPIKSSPGETGPRPKRAIKSIRFDLSEPDNTAEPVGKSLSSLVPKTPNPPRVNIYVPESVKSTKKKNVEVSKDEQFSRAFLSAPRASGITTGMQKKIPEKLKVGLQTKTKLLTRKLKLSENVEAIKVENHENDPSQGNVGPSTRSSGRRKLNSHVESSKCNENGMMHNTGAVKRSSRLNK